MQRQRSILSFFKNSSPPENKSSSTANTLDLNQSVQFSAKQTKPISSSLPELSSGSSAPPEISGTDTPPEKLPRQILPSKFPENGESSRPSLFSSIMHKFAKVDDKSTSRERNQVEGGSSNGCSTSNESGISQRLSKHELPFHQKSSIYAVESRGSGEGFLSKLESDLDILGPETPATRRSFSRFKRVQEDSVGNDSNNINTKLMNSSKRLKIAQNSPPENKKCMDTSESSSSKFVWLNPSSIRDANRRRPGDPLYDKRTLYIPPEDLKKMSASQKQYWNVKKQYMDVVLFFKVGKFYELYELDAEIGHKELDWKMTFSGVGKCRQVGISESGIDEAVQKLISRGYKVGRMEQTETSDQAKARGGATSVIQRKLVHVVTPSTITDGNIGPDAVHLLTLKEGSRSENGSTIYGFAFVDCVALKFWVGSISDDASCLALGALLMQVSPKEVIFESRGLCKEAQKALKKYSSPGHTSLQSSAALSVTDFVDASEVRELVQSRGYFKGSFNSWDHGFDGDVHHDVAICALGGLCSHLSRLMLNDVLCNGEILPYLVYRGCLRLDGQSLVNLEIFSNSADGGTSGTLYKYLDNCLTLSGKRLLRSWICHPLKDVVEINNRLNAVEELITHPEATYVVAQYLRRLPDIERLLGRVKASVGSSATLLLPLVGEKVLKQRVKTFGSLVKGMRIGLDLLLLLQEKENELLSLSKVLDVPQLSGSSGLDKLLSQFESAVDSDFPNYSNHVVSSSDGETLSALIELFVESDTQWSHIVHALNCIDVLLSFAATTSSSCRTMCRPTLLPANSICQEGCGRAVLQIKGLWHPCAALGTNEDTIVPNDIYLGEDSTGLCPGTLLLTGPNMGGKSTLLRATCLAVILAQLGCYVPCEMCVLTPVDTIFTRLGATDRIMTGESTFLIECTETASVLQSATQDSLVLLDELGRGTSTFDGYAIAYAVFHHLVEKVKCRLLFATHYHSLTKEFASHPNVKLQHMACTFRPKPGSTFTGDQELVFLYRLASGACPESYGLQVALMAGISKKVVEVAAKASQKMKHSLQKNFSTSEQRSEFSTLHEYWLKALLSLTKGRECSLDEDACDTFLCLYHELKSSYQMAKLIK